MFYPTSLAVRVVTESDVLGCQSLSDLVNIVLYCQVKKDPVLRSELLTSPHRPMINNYQQFRFNWSVWLEIDCGIVSCSGAVKFSSGGQNSRSWLAVRRLARPNIIRCEADWHPWHPCYPLLRLRFLQKHFLGWLSWASRAGSDLNIIHIKDGFLFSSIPSPPLPCHNLVWRNVWPVLLCLSVPWLMVSVNITLHPVTINPTNVNKFSTKF